MDESIKTYPTSREMVLENQPTYPVYCIYPHLVQFQAKRFLTNFSGDVLYAVKANPQPAILQLLYAAGVRCFDTASLQEIILVRGLFSDAECYFMAPCKLLKAAELAYHDFGVRHFVADHQSEVDTLLEVTGEDATIHIRMKAFDTQSVYEFSSKFGAEDDEVERLLQYVFAAGRRPGLAFNIGSLCRHPSAYQKAITAAVERVRRSQVQISSLDIGGGFPICYPSLEVSTLESFYTAIRDAVAAHDLLDSCRLLCEPGRALVASGQSFVVQVIMIKGDQVFLNDGIYGNFSELTVSNNTVSFPSCVIRKGGDPSPQMCPYTVFGPTCDSADVLPYKLDLPIDLRQGDWVEFGLTGAYSNAVCTSFNGFQAKDWVYIDAPACPPGVTLENDLI